MAKRRKVVKLSPAQKWENEANRLKAKRDAAIMSLVKAVPALAKAEREFERAKRKEELARVEAKAKKAEATKPSSQPSSHEAIKPPASVAVPTPKRKRRTADDFRADVKRKKDDAVEKPTSISWSEMVGDDLRK